MLHTSADEELSTDFMVMAASLANHSSSFHSTTTTSSHGLPSNSGYNSFGSLEADENVEATAEGSRDQQQPHSHASTVLRSNGSSAHCEASSTLSADVGSRRWVPRPPPSQTAADVDALAPLGMGQISECTADISSKLSPTNTSCSRRRGHVRVSSGSHSSGLCLDTEEEETPVPYHHDKATYDPILRLPPSARLSSALFPPRIRARTSPDSEVACRTFLPSLQLQEYGCCVFFFPQPFLSWLFPFSGQVSISNAEGTKLYTFESNYYVREECLVDVLDGVLCDFSVTRGKDFKKHSADPADDDNGNVSDYVRSYQHTGLSSSTRLPMSPSVSGDEIARMVSPTSSRSSHRRPHRPSYGSKSNLSANDHTHTHCVRVWDLKPLLMEGRSTRPVSRIAAATSSAMWAKFVEFYTLLENNASVTVKQRNTTFGSSSSETEEGSGNNLSEDNMRQTSSVNTTPQSPQSANGREGRTFRLLDTETAHFYNRTLQATLNIFRGSPEGSAPTSDILQQYRSSFSFVGFVLEACGLGGSTLAVSPAGPSENTSWGTIKLMAHVFIFGEWYRRERRLWRVIHGGTVLRTLIVWTVLLFLCYQWMLVWWSPSSGAAGTVQPP